MLRNITPLEKKIVSYLAMNPESNIQRIQRGLGFEDRNYPTIYNAVLRLKEKGYLKAKKGLSEKNVTINKYCLNTLGLSYVLLHTNEDISQVIEKNEKDLPTFQPYAELMKLLKPSTAKKVMMLAAKLVLVGGVDILLFDPSLWRFTDSELRELRRAAKKVDATRKFIQESAKALYEFAFSNGEEKEGVES